MITTEMAMEIFQALKEGEAPLGYRMFSPEQNELFLALEKHLIKKLGANFLDNPNIKTVCEDFLNKQNNNKNLSSLETAEEKDSPRDALINLLTCGSKGYKGEITRFNPEPSEDNNYLWDDKRQVFEGQFIDASGDEEEIYDFVLKQKKDGSMTRSYKRQ